MICLRRYRLAIATVTRSRLHQLFISGDVLGPHLRALDQFGGGQQGLTGQGHHLGLLLVGPVTPEQLPRLGDRYAL